MLVHIWQHWAITKATFKWKILIRNKVTFLTIIVFILMTLNIIVFVFKVNETLVNLHHTIAHIFWAVIILHTITKTKRFFQLFKKPKNER
jgi:EamA domain-containing membrane protein RarD